jgi:hypothetical protein
MVPWWYVHPLSDHATIRPAQNVRPTNSLLRRFYYCNTSTLLCFTIATLGPCNILLLLHFDPVMFYYCDTLTLLRFITVTFRPKVDRLFGPLKSYKKVDDLTLCGTSTYCNFGQPTAVIFCPILILIYFAFVTFKETLAWNFSIWRDYSTRFSVPWRTAATRFMAVKGTVAWG